MIEPQLQARFSRGCTLAALDYTAAAQQAWFEAAEQMLQFWQQAFSLPAASSRSWYRHPDSQGAAVASAWLSPRSAPGAALVFQGLANAQAKAWQSMMTAPWTLSPAAWPMAFVMMSSGVPQSVAWPAAEANAAAVDAAQAATEAVEQAFSSYRSDGGHAVAQVVMLPIKASLAAVAALPFAAGWPGSQMQFVFSPWRG